MTGAVVVAVRNEPPDRVAAVAARVARQRDVEPLHLVVAVGPGDRAHLPPLAPTGAIGRVTIVDNPSGGRSSGLNAAVAVADAQLVCRLDARSLPSDDHVARSFARLEGDASVGVVGGVQRPVAVVDDVIARGAARALRNPWLLGGAAYRRPGHAGPVDTVYLGAFRRDELLALGGYDERLAANEDFELCQRYRNAGYVVWLEEGLVVDYEPRTGLPALWRQYVAFGRSKVRYWRATGDRPNNRQALALGAAVAGAAVSVLGGRRVRRRLMVCGLIGVAALDHLGDRQGDAAERAAAIAAYGATNGGWVAGVVMEALSETFRRRPRPAARCSCPP